MGKTDHLVVLMMENRSFDHMLGFLKAPDYDIEGLDGTESNPSAEAGQPDVTVTGDAHTVNDLNPDPGHEFLDVNVQIFGNKQGLIDGPLMEGFVKNYAMVSDEASHGARIMKCFTPATLPVLTTLAKRYAICDHWFSSVPGPTIPNRLFVHGAHSGGSLVQDAIAAPAGLKTIFEVMNDPNNPNTFRIYTSGASVLLANIYLLRRQGFFHPYSDFRHDCLHGDLPAYTFIEPRYDDDPGNGTYANSQHPDFAVDEGEGLIADVYQAIRDSPLWKSTLLLIAYDEHGGIYDHVPPPTLVPDPKNPVQPSINPAFAFDRLGVRVPAVLISPFIKPGTIVSTRFDHCSIVATVRKLFCPNTAPFNWREAQAATFEGVLNRATARTDTVVLPEPVVAPPPAGSDARIPPDVRKPTDLSVAMANAMQHSLNILNITTPMHANDIHTAADATTFFRQANAAIAADGH